jgi:TonB-dependent receptor
MTSKLRRALSLIVILANFMGSPYAFAQVTRATVSGTAKDTTGSHLQGAQVQLDPGGRKVATDTDGQFRIPDVQPGDYTLTVSYLGFSVFKKAIKVESGEPFIIDVVMQIGSVSDEVFIKAERPQGEAEAINIERVSDDIVQVLPAKVITSLPNTNIADAVGRLPSVTLERDEGEGKYVQIRGTEPRLSNVTINGIHVPSPEGQVRNIKLDAVPSDIVDRIEVFKTLSPNQDGDAIGGSVNLVTKTAREKPTYTLAAQGGYTPIQDGRTLDSFSGTIGQRFGPDHRIGALFGGTFDHNDRGIDDLEPTQAIGKINGRNFAFINSEDFRTYKYYRTRYGFNGNFDYLVKPGLNVYVRGLYADFHDYGDTWVYTPNVGAIVSNNGPQTTFDNTGNMAFRHYIRRPDQGVYSIDMGANQVISSTVISYQFAISRGHNYGGQDFPTTNFSGPTGVTFGLNESDPYRPKISPLDGTNIYDPTKYALTQTVLPNYRSAELDYQGRLALSHSYSLWSHASTFEMGFAVRDAHKTQNENDQFFNATGNFLESQLLGNQSNPSYYDRSFGGYGPLTSYKAIQNIIAANLGSGFTANTDKDHIVSDPANWDTHERVIAGYLMDSIQFKRFRLQGGLRIESTSENFRANEVSLNNGAYVATTPVTGTSSYVNLLPSVQAQVLLEKNTNLRLAYFRAIARPNFTDIVPAIQADPNTSPKSLQVGNPSLKPTTANNYDILVEHYFQPLGILQAGFFYKALSNPIYSTVSFVPATDPNFPGYLRQQSINGPSAHITGIEAAWQQRLSFLPGMLSGLGVSANYSYTTSRVTFPAGFSSTVPGTSRIDHPALQRQAPNTWNLGLTYDRSRFSMRFAVSHNDANIFAYGYIHDPTNPNPNVDKDPILGLKGPLADQYLYAHTQFDIQGSYRLYKGLEVVVSGLNLSNEVFGFYTGSPIYPNQREYYKPSIIFGLRYISGAER